MQEHNLKTQLHKSQKKVLLRNPVNVKCIQNFPLTKNTKQIKQFLGLIYKL